MKFALCAGSFAEDITAGRISIYNVLDLAIKYQIGAVEIREDLLADKKTDLPCIKKIAAEKGIDLIYASRIWPLNKELAIMKDNALVVRQGIEDTAFLGIDTYKIGFGPIDKLTDLTEEYFEIVSDFTRLAEQRKITLCMENSDKCQGSDPGTIKAFIDKIGSYYLKTTYDCGNYAISGHDPLAALEIFTEKTGYVHFKDVKDGESRPTWIGNGNIDFAGILKILNKVGYNGFICFEFIMNISRLEEIEKSMKYLKMLYRRG